MTEFLPFIVIGITSGAVYGLAGVGLVLTYRTSGVFNFAHGALATAGAYLFFELTVNKGLPWPVAMGICVVVLALLLGGAMELIARRLTRSPASVVVVATIGVLLVLQGFASIRYGQETRTIAPFLPTDTFAVGSVNIGYDQLIIVLTGVGVSGGLALLLSRTRLGVAMRGVVDDPELLELTGFDAPSVRRIAWIIGGGVAVLSGILLAPIVGLDPIRLTYLVVQAFGAAAIGRFKSLPLTFVGGLVIGIVASVGQKYASDYPLLIGLPASVPFIALFLVLLASGRGKLPAPGLVRRNQPERFTPPPLPVLIVGGAIAVVAVVLLPSFADARLPVFTNAVGFLIMFLSLGLLVKTAGQVSLCHAAFVAVGAVAFSRLTQEAGLPWFLALLGAGLIAMPIGALVSLPAIRLSGIYLALATFAFGLLMENLVYRSDLMFGSNIQRLADKPVVPGLGRLSDKEYFYLASAVALVCILAVVWLLRTRMGRLLRALADSPLALSTYGTNTTTTLVLLFSISAFFAGVAGGVIATGTGAAGAGGLGSLQSLLWVAIIAITGSRIVLSSVLAALLLAVLPSYLPDNAIDKQTVAFGLLAVIASLIAANEFDGVARVRADLVESIRTRTRGRGSARRDDLEWRRAASSRGPAPWRREAARAERPDRSGPFGPDGGNDPSDVQDRPDVRMGAPS